MSGLRVTRILSLAGLTDFQWASDEAMARGTAVHAATEYHDRGDLDESSIHETIRPALSEYRRFLAECDVEVLSIEEEVAHTTLGYRGRLDRRARINGVEGVIDIKGIYKADWQSIQLALYAECFDRPLKRWTLHLPSDGTTYRLIEHKDRDDRRVALAALTIAAWKEKHGLLD